MLVLIVVIFCLAAAGVAAASCTSGSKPQDKVITLSFDSKTAYFTSNVPLTAIAGDLPAETDDVERATIKLTATDSAKMELKLVYDENGADIPYLMVRVDEQEPLAVQDGVILYTSQEAEREKTLSVVFYLAKGAGEASSQKTLSFRLELTGAE